MDPEKRKKIKKYLSLKTHIDEGGRFSPDLLMFMMLIFVLLMVIPLVIGAIQSLI